MFAKGKSGAEIDAYLTDIGSRENTYTPSEGAHQTDELEDYSEREPFKLQNLKLRVSKP